MEASYKFYLVLVFAMFFTKQALAAQHVVGGSQGWDESTDFSSWSSGQTFKVGDQLVFKYTALHSVVELGSDSAYKNCDIGSATDSMNGGNSVVKLNKAGTRYFACGTLGHCDQGMKVTIKTVSAADASSAPGSSSSSTPNSTSAASAFHFATSFILLIASMSGFLFII
ncbi:mavicyanin [Cornus florida]|uniref:mavicyanin n=1 Tax=Cornus florida TaxID=4283 RepID=UPI00289F545C|nr:mavicyanin [Cornus florida]